MTTPRQSSRYYPSPSKVGPLHDDFRLLFDHMYSQQAENESLRQKLAESERKHAALAQQVANGPSNTKINGFNVVAQPPNAGDTIRWDPASQQFKFGA